MRLLVLVVVVEVVGTKAGLCRNGPAAAAASGTIMEQAQTPPKIIVIRVGRAGVIAIAEVDGDWGGRFLLFGGIDEEIDWTMYFA